MKKLIKMKNIIPNSGAFAKTIGALALMFTGFQLPANTTSDVAPEKVIEERIKFPKLNDSQIENERVKVVFTTDALGKVNYCLAKTPNTELKNSIEKQFSQLTLSNTKPETAYTIILNFKTL